MAIFSASGAPGCPPPPLGWPSIHMCVVSHHIFLPEDLAVAHLQRSLDQHTAAIRVLARLPERHPILAEDLPLDAVREVSCPKTARRCLAISAFPQSSNGEL